jgi:hypothetical protein
VRRPSPAHAHGLQAEPLAVARSFDLSHSSKQAVSTTIARIDRQRLSQQEGRRITAPIPASQVR